MGKQCEWMEKPKQTNRRQRLNWKARNGKGWAYTLTASTSASIDGKNWKKFSRHFGERVSEQLVNLELVQQTETQKEEQKREIKKTVENN